MEVWTEVDDLEELFRGESIAIVPLGITVHWQVEGDKAMAGYMCSEPIERSRKRAKSVKT